ncbi:MAG TPA: ABC transporter permease, partial [Acidobacteriota bacterium]
MKKQNVLPVIFASFFHSGFNAKRTRVFILLSLIPVVLMLAARVMESVGSVSAGDAANFFARVMLVLYFQLLIPILALFFGSTIVNEELDNKTLVYLTTVPVRRRTVLLGKYLAAFLLAALLVGCGFLLCFLAASFTRLGQADAWEELAV